MTATATHDTKRGEDARARVLAISELADEWADAVRRWQALNDRYVSRAGGQRAPSRLHEYMLYQTLIGAWPFRALDAGFTERMQAYALKAAREGKVETSWTNPNEAYERALTEFVHAILERGSSSEFIDAFGAIAQRIALIGALNSLVQVTLKATMPGVPDFYQGTELWDLSLVDPDNRRPVDFSARRGDLTALSNETDWRALISSWPDGRIKFALTQQLLAWRQQRPSLFERGGYQPLAVSGPDHDHVIAFARVTRREAAIVVAGRHFATCSDGGRCWPSAFDWNAVVHLDDFAGLHDRLRPNCAIAGKGVAVSDLFDAFPVALLDVVHGTPSPPRR